MGQVHPISSMFRLILLVALASLCSAGGGGYKEAMMKKYAHHKIMEDCFGKEEVKKYYVMMMDASKKCGSDRPVDGTEEIDFREIINEIRSAALKMGSRSPSNQYYQLVPVMQGGRYRRDAHPTAEKLQYLKEKMTHKIANVTCMLRELNWINEDKTPNYDFYETFISEITDPYLKNQLFYSFDMCKDYANCMPVKKAKNPMLKELGTYLFFHKCIEMKELQACFKKDFRYMMADYGFDAVEEKINMGLEILGEEVHEEGYEAYKTLEGVLSGEF